MTSVELTNPGSFSDFEATCEVETPYQERVAAYGKVVAQYRQQLEEQVGVTLVPAQATSEEL